jgi:hypothetical protein
MLGKKNKLVWFKKVRGSYLPCSLIGWMLYVPFIMFLVATLYLSFKGGRTYAGQFYFIFPQYICALIVMHWLASRFSK